MEEGIVIRVEEAVQDIEGIKEIRSTASEGAANISLEIDPGYNIRDILIDIKNRVDAIDTFPEDARQPIVRAPTIRRTALFVVISAETDEHALRAIARHA